MPDWTIGRTVLIHKDDFAYISHPAIVVLDTGEWIAAFNITFDRTLTTT